MHTIRWFFCKLVFTLARAMRGSRGGVKGDPPPPPEKSQKYRISLQYWTGSPEILKAKLAGPMRGSRGGGGSRPPPMKNHKNIEFLSNTGPDLLKFSKLPSQHSMLHHHRHASSAPFKWSFVGGLVMARF